MPVNEVKNSCSEYKFIAKERCLGGINWDGNYLNHDHVKFKQLYLAGCDIRLLENYWIINFALDNIELTQ